MSENPDEKKAETLEKDPGFWSELFQYARQSKKWWLIPVILVLILVGLLAIFMSSQVIAPFIYTVF